MMNIQLQANHHSWSAVVVKQRFFAPRRANERHGSLTSVLNPWKRQWIYRLIVDHRPICQYMQRNAAITQMRDSFDKPYGSDDWPSLRERQILRAAFYEAHQWSFEKAIGSAVRLRGGVDKFDFKNHFIRFDLRYRPDCGGNPSVAFNIIRATILPLSADQLPETLAVLEASRLSREAEEANRNANEEDFVGLFLVMHQMEDYGEWFTTQMRREKPMFKTLLDRPSTPHAMWLLELQKTVDLGIVYGQLEEDDIYWKFGYLKKRGSKWRWQPMSSEELVALGLPADYKGRII